jgi:hypothetical protein
MTQSTMTNATVADVAVAPDGAGRNGFAPPY